MNHALGRIHRDTGIRHATLSLFGDALIRELISTRPDHNCSLDQYIKQSTRVLLCLVSVFSRLQRYMYMPHPPRLFINKKKQLVNL